MRGLARLETPRPQDGQGLRLFREANAPANGVPVGVTVLRDCAKSVDRMRLPDQACPETGRLVFYFLIKIASSSGMLFSIFVNFIVMFWPAAD